jgi:hypothetical protein
MGDIVNLRKARKVAKRKEEDARAQQNRLVHGRAKSARMLQGAMAAKARRDLEAHRLEPGDEG